MRYWPQYQSNLYTVLACDQKDCALIIERATQKSVMVYDETYQELMDCTMKGEIRLFDYVCLSKMPLMRDMPLDFLTRHYGIETPL